MLTPQVAETCILHHHTEPMTPDTFQPGAADTELINPALAANPATNNNKQQALKEGL